VGQPHHGVGDPRQRALPERCDVLVVELWNGPDNSYWHGTFAEYAKLYDYTEAAIHGVLRRRN